MHDLKDQQEERKARDKGVYPRGAQGRAASPDVPTPRGVPPRSRASEDVIRQLLKQVHTSGTFPEKTSEVVQVKRSDSQRKHVCARRGYIYKTHIIYHTKYIIYDSCNCNFSHIITSVCMCVYIYIISYIIIISVITIIYCNNYGS